MTPYKAYLISEMEIARNMGEEIASLVSTLDAIDPEKFQYDFQKQLLHLVSNHVIDSCRRVEYRCGQPVMTEQEFYTCMGNMSQ